MGNFLATKNCIKRTEIFAKFFSLHPAEYKIIKISNPNLKSISELVIEEGVGEQIDVNEYLNFHSEYTLVTISNMNKCIVDINYGERISPRTYIQSTKKLRFGDVIVSRNASLGKISLIDKEFNGILNGGISFLRLTDKYKYYLIALFILDYGKDYLTVLTSGGGTQKNAKRQNLLDVKIPFPTYNNHKTPTLITEYISLIAQNIINKEQQISIKQSEINNLIYSELKSNSKSKYTYRSPRKSDLLTLKRIDTGLFTEKYRKENYLIEDYVNGFFQIDISNFKSGSTPEIRVFNGKKSILKWVTPTDISDEGFYMPTEKISMSQVNNINNDCVLFINRTSKGSRGEFVGITSFYDFNYYGKGHHNQGIYRIENMQKNEMLFISAFMNSTIMRKICGSISIGSKMKEMKSNDFSSLKFPNLPKEVKTQIIELYYNDIKKIKANKLEIDLNTYKKSEELRNNDLGIFQLNTEIIELKRELKYLISCIINDTPIDIKFKTDK